jgi:hypothetical protein
MTRIKYPAPRLPDGRIQHVAIVCRNRDTLLGHIMAVQSILASVSEAVDIDNDFLAHFDPGLDSSRFNEIIDDGVSGAKMSVKQIREIMDQKIETILNKEGKHPENKKNILDPGFFSVDCSGCGNFIRWNNAKEIPHENFRCDICDRMLIHYIHLDDEDIIFDEGEEV